MIMEKPTRQFSSTVTGSDDFQMHVSNIVSNSKPIWVVWSFIIYRFVKHFQTLQPTQHQLLLCDWVLIKVLPRKTSLDPRSRGLYQVFLTPSIAVKCQGLKTWVRVLQQQAPASTKDPLDLSAPLFHQADVIIYQQSRVSQVPLHDTTSW